jgi:putative oxidoreductase
MKAIVLAVRILLGLTFVVFGANFFLNLFDIPRPDPTPAAGHFMTAITQTNYMKVVKCFEITGGVLLLTGFFVPLGLVLVTPVIVNIVLYDFVLMGQPGLGVPLLAMALFLIWAYRPYFAPVFTFNAKAAGCCKTG